MSEARTKKFIMVMSLSFIFIFCLVPFVWMLVVSFSGDFDFLGKGRYLFTLGNYIDILTVKSLHFVDYLKNSVIISSVSAFFITAIAGLSAYSVVRISFPGKVILILSVLALSMFPQISIVGYLFKLFSGFGWLNTYNALIFPYISWGLPLALWILTSYFVQIPLELDKQALVDGASRIQIFLYVILPLALPALLSTFLILFIFSYNEFLFALMLTSDYSARTIPVGIALFQGLHGELPWGSIMASATIASIPVVLIAILFQRYIVQGLMRGALKG